MQIRANSVYVLRAFQGQAKVRCVCVMVLCALFLSSCSGVGRYSPKPSIAKGVVQNASFSKAVAVVNAQDSTEEHALGFRGIIVDYHEFTQSVVDALKAELENNGATVRDGAEKRLSVTVTQVDMKPGPMVFRGAIEADVKTGDGHTERFRATRASYASGWNAGTNPTKPLNSSFEDLVKSILENDKIQAYIEN